MSWPIDIVLVRHGQSEHNLAQDWSKKGDERFWTPEFHDRHTSLYRLTELGVEQAESAGVWIRENISDHFDRYYVSEYVRAKETACHLKLDRAEWFSEFFMREQDFGVLLNNSDKERKEKYGEILKGKELDAFYWSPPGGESIANVCLRVERWLSDLKRSSSGMKVICVCHKDIMKAIRIRIEKIRQQDWDKLDDDPNHEIHNCQILHYTRRNPETGAVRNGIHWMRSICPWDLRRSTNEWREIIRPPFTNEELVDYIGSIPRMVHNPEGDNLLNLQMEGIREDKRVDHEVFQHINNTQIIQRPKL